MMLKIFKSALLNNAALPYVLTALFVKPDAAGDKKKRKLVIL